MPPEDAARIQAWLHGQRDALLDLLERLVLSESPSTDPGSQDAVFTILAGELEALGFRKLRLRGRSSGGSLYARPTTRPRPRPFQLLLGHCDTVWPIGTLASMPLSLAEGRMKGPGVYDMKGGLAMIVFALRALRELGLEPSVTPVLFVNSDEEIGSYDSTRHIARLARRADRVYIFEPSLGPEGRIKTARKGVGRFTIRVKGRAAHAGLDPEGGVSAILELSHLIQQLFELNDVERGISVNVGTIEGGLRPNVIAPASSAVVDVRVPTHEDARRIEAAVRDLRVQSPDAQVEVEGNFNRPPMEPTPAGRRLWELARSAGRQLGLELGEGTAGGASDGNTTNLYTPTLDGLGAVGDGAHASHEHLVVDALFERAALLALLVLAEPLEELERSP